MKITEKSKLQLILNSKKAKEAKELFTQKMLCCFRTLGYSIAIWKTWPFVTIIKWNIR